MSSQHQLQDLLKASKTASGLSVRAIAHKAGVSHGTVSNALNNSPRTHPITDEMLSKLAKGFGLPYPRLKKAHDQDRAARPAPVEESDDVADVPAAILADTRLLPEARAHLLNQYQLLLRIQKAESDAPIERTTSGHVLAHQPTVAPDRDIVTVTDEPVGPERGAVAEALGMAAINRARKKQAGGRTRKKAAEGGT